MSGVAAGRLVPGSLGARRLPSGSDKMSLGAPVEHRYPFLFTQNESRSSPNKFLVRISAPDHFVVGSLS